jgi:hypothetical protein
MRKGIEIHLSSLTILFHFQQLEPGNDSLPLQSFSATHQTNIQQTTNAEYKTTFTGKCADAEEVAMLNTETSTWSSRRRKQANSPRGTKKYRVCTERKIT